MLALVLFAIFGVSFYFIHWHYVVKRRKYLERWTTKPVFITGCDSGFGKSLALRLDKKGVPVFCGCFTERGVSSLTKDGSSRLRATTLDVTNDQNIEGAYKWTLDQLKQGGYRGLWALVNNAGVSGPSVPVEFYKRENYRSVFEVNLYGMVEMTRTFLPLIKASGGRIVNMCSIAGIHANEGMAPYVASKWAVRGWSESLRREKSKWGIGVSTVFPTLFSTDISTSYERQALMNEQCIDQVDDFIRQEYGDELIDFLKSENRLCTFVKATSRKDVNPVLEAYEHALFSVYPRHMYYPGDGRLVKLLEHLPGDLVDFILKHINKNATPLPLALINEH